MIKIQTTLLVCLLLK